MLSSSNAPEFYIVFVKSESGWNVDLLTFSTVEAGMRYKALSGDGEGINKVSADLTQGYHYEWNGVVVMGSTHYDLPDYIQGVGPE